MNPRCLWQGSPAFHGFMAALVLRARCEQDKEPSSCVHVSTPQSGNPQNKECMFTIASPRPRNNPLQSGALISHMNWFFCSFQVLGHLVFLSHKRAQSLKPVCILSHTSSWSQKQKQIGCFVTYTPSGLLSSTILITSDFTQVKGDCNSAFLSQAVLLLFPFSKCCIC